MRALIDSGADVNKANDQGETPLLVAASNGHEVIVRALIDSWVDVNKTPNDSKTPLRFAASNGHDAVARMLIDSGADARDGAVPDVFPDLDVDEADAPPTSRRQHLRDAIKILDAQRDALPEDVYSALCETLQASYSVEGCK